MAKRPFPEIDPLPIFLAEHKALYEIMETDFDRFIPGILDHLAENGYPKSLEEVFILPKEELQKLSPMVKFAREMRKVCQNIIHNHK